MADLDPLTIVAGLLAPALFWIGYLYYNDRIHPEPFAPVGATYVLGIASGFVGLQAYVLAESFGMPEAFVLSETNRPAFFLYVVGFVGVVEELVKALPFFLVVLRFKHFDEIIDGIVYASVIALGYATYENILYLPYMDGPERWGRAIASPLVHLMFASVWGVAVARAHIERTSLLRATLPSVAIAAAVHGVYDFVSTDPVFAPAAALVIGVVWVWWMRTVRQLQQQARARMRG
jgi:RsiW-degrading membrane proteinase PrsW (M82 family)